MKQGDWRGNRRWSGDTKAEVDLLFHGNSREGGEGGMWSSLVSSKDRADERGLPAFPLR